MNDAWRAVAESALVVAALPFIGVAAYLALLALASRRRVPATAAEPACRFDVIVPAHDEEGVIATTVASLRALDYPADRFRVIVVADNCTDRTAEIARRGGVRVIERQDPTLRGKGYALKLAFDTCVQEGVADVVVVVDADTVVSPNLLRAFATRIAAGEEVVQASYNVRNVGLGWRVRLMALAFVLFHDVRSLGRERLGLSCGLRGNGMGFRRDVLARVPYAAFSLVEDLEYGIALGMAGIRVAFVEDARVLGDVPSGERASRSQRARWEDGRAAVARSYRGPLLRAAWARRDRVLFDLAMDLLVPPLATVAAAIVLGLALAVAARLAGWTGTLPVVAWGLSLAGVVVYVWRGGMLTGSGLRVLGDLAWAPVYMFWKLVLRLFVRDARSAEWVRTTRDVVK